ARERGPRFGGDGRRKRGALSLAARHGRRVEVGLQAETVEELGELVLLWDRAPVGEGGLLLHQGDGQGGAPAPVAVPERGLAQDDGEERGLAGAVAADEADALPALQGERGAVEERQFAVGEAA